MFTAWQDLVFGAGSLVFVVALLPSVFSKHKPALSTSVLTALVLYTFAVTYFTLGFYISAAITLTTALVWTILAVQRFAKMMEGLFKWR